MPQPQGLQGPSLRFSLPSLNTYLTISSILFCSGGVSFYRIFKSMIEQDESNIISGESGMSIKTLFIIERFSSALAIHRLLYYIFLNSCCAFIALFGKAILNLSFDNITTQDRSFLSKKFQLFVQARLIFLIFVSQRSLIDDICSWLPWVVLNTVCILLNEFVIYRNSNFNYMNPVHNNNLRNQQLIATGAVMAVSSAMILCPIFLWNFMNVHYCIFMLADGTLIFMQAIYLFTKAAIFEHSVLRSDNTFVTNMVHRADICYELFHEIIEFVNYLHMIFFSQLALTYCCIFFLVKAQHFFSRMSNKIKKYLRHQAISRHINVRFRSASEEDLKETCSICWQPMKSARKLPCGHVFHEFCLRRWLEQDSSCAVCRQSLDLVDANQGRLQPDARQDNPLNDEVVNTLQQFIDTLSPYNNRFSRWWTRFLFESMNEGQVNEMVNRVSEMFPQVARDTIRNLVNNTGSINLTIEAILATANNHAVIEPIDDGNEFDESSLASNSDGGSISDTENADLNDVGANNSYPLPNASGVSITNSSVVEAPPIPQRYQQSWIGLKMDEMIRTNRRKYIGSDRAKDLQYLHPKA